MVKSEEAAEILNALAKNLSTPIGGMGPVRAADILEHLERKFITESDAKDVKRHITFDTEKAAKHLIGLCSAISLTDNEVSPEVFLSSLIGSGIGPYHAGEIQKHIVRLSTKQHTEYADRNAEHFIDNKEESKC